MKNRMTLIFKTILLALFSLLWFLLLQGEYEMITQPQLQNDFPGVNGVGAVYLLGLIILIITVISIFIFLSIINSRRMSVKNSDTL